MPGSQITYPEAGGPSARGCSPRPVAAAAARHGDGHCPTCLERDDHDEWNAGVRGETPLQRVDRAYGEILQEVRVAQTGVQILFAFLLALAFQARFGSTTNLQRDLYGVTLMLCSRRGAASGTRARTTAVR